jgi:hypothetical protein
MQRLSETAEELAHHWSISPLVGVVPDTWLKGFGTEPPALLYVNVTLLDSGAKPREGSLAKKPRHSRKTRRLLPISHGTPANRLHAGPPFLWRK